MGLCRPEVIQRRIAGFNERGGGMGKRRIGGKASRFTALGIAALLIGAGLAGQSQATPNPTVSERHIFDGGGQPTISVNPTDANNLVLASEGVDPDAPPWAYYTKDGGATWPKSTPWYNNFAHVAFAGSGVVGITDNRYQIPGGFDAVRVRTSTDGGANFDFPVVVLEEGDLVRWPGHDPEFVPICAEGIGANFEAVPKLAAHRTPGTDSSDTFYLTTSPTLDVDSDGLCDTTNGYLVKEVIVRSTDGGLTWGGARVFPDECSEQVPTCPHITGGRPISIAVGADGAVYLPQVYITTPAVTDCVKVYKSTDGATTFQPSTGTCAFPLGTTQVSGMGAAAHPLDPNRVYVAFSTRAWNEIVSDIWVTSSPDGGASWTAPVLVSDTAAPRSKGPVISVSSSGRVDVAWADGRNWIGTPNLGGDFYYSFSTDGGASFAPNIRLTAETARYNGSAEINSNRFMGIASWGNETWVSYAQDRHQDEWTDVFVNTVTHN